MGLPPVLNIVLFVLLLVSWLVLLGGVSALHDETEGWKGPDEETLRRRHWWAVSLAFFVAVLLIVSIILGKIDEWKGVVVAFAAMASAYLMPVAELFLSALDNHLTDKMENIYGCCAAGTIMAIMVFWLIIILYGNDSFRQMVESKAEALKGEPTA